MPFLLPCEPIVVCSVAKEKYDKESREPIEGITEEDGVKKFGKFLVEIPLALGVSEIG